MPQNLFKPSPPAIKATCALSNLRAFICTGCLCQVWQKSHSLQCDFLLGPVYMNLLLHLVS